MTQSSASPKQQADDSSDDNVDDNLAPPAPSLTGSRCRSRAGQRTCALLGVIPEALPLVIMQGAGNN
jgi:hypothetical protein